MVGRADRMFRRLDDRMGRDRSCRQLATTKVIACDEAAWRLFGLSFAGWNAVVSASSPALRCGALPYGSRPMHSAVMPAKAGIQYSPME